MRTTLVLALTLVLLGPSGAAALDQYESPPVHPLDLSPSGNLLFAAHTAAHRLVVFDVNRDVPVRIRDVAVGLDPVTVRARTDGEVWVVNHLGDSISIVDVATGHVVQTLLVGDEPTDVVFAGEPSRAFVVLSQEDRVVVYDAARPDRPLASIPLRGSDPRALAVSPDGRRVYVTIHESGNNTSVVHPEDVGTRLLPPAPDPPLRDGLPAPPRTGLVVRHDGIAWRDEAGQDWSSELPYTLTDQDVFAIDTEVYDVRRVWRGVGTHLFNVGIDPRSGDLLVTNQEAHNQIRFEPNLRSRFAESRLSRLDSSGDVVVHDLNPHVDRSVPGTAADRASSVSLPLDLAVAESGTAYVASYGTARVAELDATGTVLRTIDVGGGPSGLALRDERRLFVLERFESDLAWIDLDEGAVVGRTTLGLDPTPSDVRAGRRLFYDAVNSSEYGDLSCATCHLFGGFDNLAWDLGDPQGDMIPVPAGVQQIGALPPFHPMKGPMTTQSLRSLEPTAPFHWRGDRPQLADFNGTFPALLGRDTELSASDFALFEAFVFSLRYPPNPYRDLDDGLPSSIEGGDPTNGGAIFLTGNAVAGAIECVDCHALPTGEEAIIVSGPLLDEAEAKVVPQLRNMYEKTRFDRTAPETVRGFGYRADGAIDDLVEFLQFRDFTFPNGDADRRDVAALMLAWDTGAPAALGAQFTARAAGDGATRVDVLVDQADAGKIDLIAHGRDGLGRSRGWVHVGSGQWNPARVGEPTLSTGELLAGAGPGTEITVTAVPLGEGVRMGVDRDGDGFLDGDELDAGSDVEDPGSQPDEVATGIEPTAVRVPVAFRVRDAVPSQGVARFDVRAMADPGASVDVFDVRGRRVRTLLVGWVGGHRTITWDLRDESGSTVGSGVYLVRLETAGTSIARRVTVVR